MISESNGLSMIRVKVTKKRAAVAVVLAARPAGPAGRPGGLETSHNDEKIEDTYIGGHLSSSAAVLG